MVKYCKTFWLAVLAGICIGIAGTVYLSVENKIVGAFLFSLGLLTIVTNRLMLFTGKVGYLFENKPKYLLELLIIWLGNFAGTGAVALAIRCTRSTVSSAVLCETKLADNPISILILSIFCGALMFIAVNGYRKTEQDFGKIIMVILPVAVFILCGFEHCVANMFYFWLADAWGLRTVLYLLLMTVGNGIGSVLFWTVERTRLS